MPSDLISGSQRLVPHPFHDQADVHGRSPGGLRLTTLKPKVALTIILVEIVVLTATSLIYYRSFTAQVEARVQTKMDIPARLANADQLRLGIFADENIMRQIVGPGLVDSMVVGRNGVVLVTLDSQQKEMSINEIRGVKPDWFDPA